MEFHIKYVTICVIERTCPVGDIVGSALKEVRSELRIVNIKNLIKHNGFVWVYITHKDLFSYYFNKSIWELKAKKSDDNSQIKKLTKIIESKIKKRKIDNGLNGKH
ncbi:hypothetical protein [[Mycoplasma] testudinis]|uniref:hypothetical protein n=1 Tax=[Mycoplasma] testudinis TaxID=33924 RepID=UPI0004802C58|nr:hypothetical protein [[Mycoplasma] testudinis]